MGIRRSSEVDALLDTAERQQSCLYARKKWIVDILRNRKRKGTILEVNPGSFVRWNTWQSLDPVARYRWRMNAVASALPGCVFCRESAALLHGLFISYANLQRIHIATSKKEHSASSRLVTRHIVEGDDVATIDGVSATSLLRTSFDCMRAYEFPDALAIADSALRVGAEKRELVGYVNGMHNFRGSSMARWAAEFADPRPENGGESVARAMMIRLGYELPDLQHPIKDSLSGKDYRADFYWELADGSKVAGELDGDQKYTNPAYMGGRTLERVILDERRRESRITLEVDRVCRFSPDDVRDPQFFMRLLDDFGVPRDTDNIPTFSKRFTHTSAW